MTIEIVDLPSYKMVIFHSFLYVYPLKMVIFQFAFCKCLPEGRSILNMVI